MNRRHALKLLSTLCASGLVLQRLPGQPAASPTGELTYGLMFGEADLGRIRDNFLHNPLFADFRGELEAFDKAAEYRFIEEELRYNDQLFHIRRLGDTAEAMAFLFLMTGDDEAARLASRAVGEIMKFERWDFFLDGDKSIAVQRGSSSTVAVALTVDFLGKRASKEEREEWIRLMGERGCEACFRTLHGIRYPQTVEGWRFDPESTFFEHRPGNRIDMNRRPEITEDTNLRAVPASALVIGTIAHELEFGKSSLTGRWMEMGRFSVEVFRHFFEPDGSYNEEVNYADYTAQHLQQALICMARHGQNPPMDLINWDGYVEYLLNTTMPTHLNPTGIVNWGDSGRHPDSGPKAALTALPLWIAARNKNALAQWYAETLGGAKTYWSVIWADPSMKGRPPAQGPRLWVSAIDRVVARTGFETDDLVVAMRSGPPANHEHADRNSIIVKCYGEELVTDPLRPPYNFSDPSWKLRLTVGHSAVLVDGRGHDHHNGAEGTNASQSYARISHHESSDRHALWTSIATQPYRLADLDIKEIVRTVVVLYGEPAVIIVDRFAKWKTPSTFTARFFGYNLDKALTREVASQGFHVGRPHAHLRADTWSSVGHNVLKGSLDIDPERSADHPFVDVTTAPAREALLVTVLSLGRDRAGTTQAGFTRQPEGVEVRSGSSRVRVQGSECLLL